MSQVDKPAENRMNLNLGMGGVRANMNPNGAQRGPQPGAQQQQQRNSSEVALDTYIYDYFIKSELWDCAQALLDARPLNLRPDDQRRRESPGRRPKHDLDGNIVGNGDTAMGGTDTKQEEDENGQRKSFPQANVPQEDFLLDWFLLFWDIYSASAMKGNGQANQMTSAYVTATQVCSESESGDESEADSAIATKAVCAAAVHEDDASAKRHDGTRHAWPGIQRWYGTGYGNERRW